ncbi:MAG: sigma-70 family RNA polymerase sigma factor [Bacteroidales bacterium]|nr:sigma-70 family RNA polymerase sigma factor [Bacteroidales bacterium]
MTKKEVETLFRQHYAAMYRLARTILYDADESKDVVSDVFVRLLRGDVVVQADKMEGYLMMAVRNRCLDVLSHKSVREQVEKLFSQELKQHRTATRNEDDRLDRLMLYIERELPPLSQQILRLRFLREMSYEEVAQEVGVSKVTVYNHLSQSLQRIKEYFSKEQVKR